MLYVQIILTQFPKHKDKQTDKQTHCSKNYIVLHGIKLERVGVDRDCLHVHSHSVLYETFDPILLRSPMRDITLKCS